MEIVLVGLNHRTAPVEVRERVSFTADQARRAADELRARGIFDETLVLSTCNRSEVYGVPPESAQDSLNGLATFLSEFHSVGSEVLIRSLYHHYDRNAVRHLFRVSAGLDSMLLGEAEILGQVRDAYKSAHEQGATGPVLNRLFQGALEVGKRVRTETQLGMRPMSVAAAGVKLAERIFGKLAGHTALVIGAGTVSEQVVSTLRDRSVTDLYIMNRSRDHAAELAEKVGGTVVEWADWQNALLKPDVVVSSISTEDPVLSRLVLESAMEARGNRALFLMDLGMPRNIESAAADLYNTYLYNLDDLSSIVSQNRQAREGEVPRAEAIIEDHVSKFLSWQASVELVSFVAALRARLREDRAAFLHARLAQATHLTPQDREQIESIMEEVLEKFLVQPAERLRDERELRRKIQNVEALRDLFLSDREKR